MLLVCLSAGKPSSIFVSSPLTLPRPVSGGLIAELFSASSRGVANGIFSWGVYYGYGLAFVFGIYLTKADVLGYGWRAPYVLAALSGLVLAILLDTTVINYIFYETQA